MGGIIGPWLSKPTFFINQTIIEHLCAISMSDINIFVSSNLLRVFLVFFELIFHCTDIDSSSLVSDSLRDSFILFVEVVEVQSFSLDQIVKLLISVFFLFILYIAAISSWSFLYIRYFIQHSPILFLDICITFYRFLLVFLLFFIVKNFDSSKIS